MEGLLIRDGGSSHKGWRVFLLRVEGLLIRGEGLLIRDGGSSHKGWRVFS